MKDETGRESHHTGAAEDDLLVETLESRLAIHGVKKEQRKEEVG